VELRSVRGDSDGDAYIVGSTPAGDWAAFDTGDLVVLDTTWKLVLASEGGGGTEPADGCRVVVTGLGSGSGAGSFNGHDGKIGEYDATGNSWSFTAPTDGMYILIHGENSTVENTGFVYDTSAWVQFSSPGTSHNNLSGLDGGTTGEYYHLTSAQHTGLTSGEIGTTYHTHHDAYFQESEFLNVSAGAGDAGKPIKLDAAGHVDASMINDGDIAHNSTGSIQGGKAGEYYHLENGEHAVVQLIQTTVTGTSDPPTKAELQAGADYTGDGEWGFAITSGNVPYLCYYHLGSTTAFAIELGSLS